MIGCNFASQQIFLLLLAFAAGMALALPSPQTQPGQPSSFSNSQNSQSNTTTAAAPLISNVPLADAQAPALPLNFTQVASSPQCEAICFPWASMTMIAQAGLVATNVTCSPTMVDTLQKCVQCGFDWVPGLSGPTAQGCLDNFTTQCNEANFAIQRKTVQTFNGDMNSRAVGTSLWMSLGIILLSLTIGRLA